MSDTLIVFAAIAGVGVIIWIIQSVTAPLVKKTNRSLLYKKQYQEQQLITRQATCFAVSAPLEEVHRQLSRYVVAKEEKAVANALYVASRSSDRIAYVLGGKLAMVFAAEIRLREEGSGVNARLLFTRWTERDGVAPLETLEQMKELIESVTRALRAADPNVQIQSLPL